MPILEETVRQTTEQVLAVRKRLELHLIPFDETHAEAAQAAWLRYGKGRHSAALNFADCMSCAAAKVSGEDLLYVGGDFTLTDVATA